MNISKWISNNIDRINQDKYISIHLDQLNINDDYFQKGIEVFKIAKENIETSNINLSGIKIELLYELSIKNTTLEGVPQSLGELKRKIDKHNPPELIISKREKGYVDYTPKIEYYMSPIPFAIEGVNSNKFDCYYTEYRTIENLLEKEPYTSWLNLSWVASPRCR